MWICFARVVDTAMAENQIHVAGASRRQVPHPLSAASDESGFKKNKIN
jgi:hypothetical protein